MYYSHIHIVIYVLQSYIMTAKNLLQTACSKTMRWNLYNIYIYVFKEFFSYVILDLSLPKIKILLTSTSSE